MGIEPTAQAWEAWVLPLYDARRRAIVDRGSPGIKRLGVELHREIQIPEVAAMPVIAPGNKPTRATSAPCCSWPARIVNAGLSVWLIPGSTRAMAALVS
jgi:hypothetical protein